MDVKPFITGDLNREAAYVLEHFGVAKPELLESLSKEDKYFLVDTITLKNL
jgi:inorganic pyrophosphatase/exopolyphosphatase